jgi:hypothetical protein
VGLVAYYWNGTKPACACKSLMRNRSKGRLGLKVIHRHRAGDWTFRRVSELVFVRGRPRAVLGWIDAGGVRTPIYICELDPAKLRKAAGLRNTYYYDDETVDPRYEQTLPAGDAHSRR